MHYLERLYRFREFGREIVYNIESNRASFINQLESELLDYFQKERDIKKCINILQNSRGYDLQEINLALNNLNNENILTFPDIPYRDFSRIYTLSLNLTHQCNLRCKYCYIDKSDSFSSCMDEKTAKDAVEFILSFKDLQGLGISFYGGEPLLNFPVLKYIVEYASKNAKEKNFSEVKYHITTNGTLLTDEIINFLKDHNIITMISIDGPASIHDAVRIKSSGEGTHSIILDQLNKLINVVDGKKKVSVSSVITNRGRLKSTYKYLSQFPLKDIKVSYVRYINESEYALTNIQMEQYMKDLRDIAIDCIELISQGIRPPYYNFENKILHLWTHTKRRFFCPAGITRFGVSPNGDIYPCGPSAAMKEWKLGTLKGGLNKRALKRWIRTSSYEKRAKCRKCWAQNLCLGDCPLRLVRSIDEKKCLINQFSTRLAIAIYCAVKEKNEIKFASLVDEEFLVLIEKIINQHY